MTRFVKDNWFLIICSILAIFLRFYKINENIVFHGELGSNYLNIKDFLLSGQIPLIGPETSHPWLSFGPIYYWIMAPFFAIFDFDPKIGAYFFAAFGFLLVLVNYYYINKIFNKNVAQISSLIIAISPLYLNYAREARFFSIVLIIFYPFFYFLLKVKEKGKGFFWLGFFYGLFFSFHYSPLIFLPVVFYYLWIIRKKVKLTEAAKAIIGILIPNLTLIFSDLLNGGGMIKNLFMWIPYRLLGFLGVYPKNNLDSAVLIKNINSIFSFFNSILLPSNFSIKFIGLLIFLVVLFFIKKTKINIALNILLLLLFSGIVTIFIHGDPPSHYFLPLIPVVVILISIGFSKMLEKNRKIAIVALILFFVMNFNYLFSESWFYKYKNISLDPVPYETQSKISEAIVNDASGKPFSLSRVGKGDEFEDNYAQNYIYLMWYLGNQPIKNARLEYKIYEEKIENNKDTLVVVDNITITKNEK